MIKRLFLLTMLGALLSGCYMAPMAFIGPVIGPAASGFTSGSIIQSAATTALNHVVAKNTGRSIPQHAFDAVIGEDHLLQAYFPQNRIVSKKEARTNYINQAAYLSKN